MSAVFEYPLRVRPAEVDRVGHVHNLEYLRWMQDAAVAHSAAYGWPTAVYYELGQGWVVRSHTIEYLAAAFVDDELIVRTWIANMKRVSSIRRYEIIRTSDEKQLVKAETNWAFVDFATHQLRRIPLDLSRAFEVVADLRKDQSIRNCRPLKDPI